MPPENPELVASSSLKKNGLSKTQIGWLAVAVSGAVMVVMNVWEATDMNSVMGGCATITLWGLTFLVGSIMRPDNQESTLQQNWENVAMVPNDWEGDDLTWEEATEIEGLFSESGWF